MKKILGLFLLLITIGACMSCSSKADKIREQQIADSLRKDSVAKQQIADSIQKIKDEEKLNEDKIAFLKSFYKNALYPTDDNIQTTEGYMKKFKKHLSDKVSKGLTAYDDGMEGGDPSEPKIYLFGDEGDYGDEGPKLQFEYLKNCWFKVTINGEQTVKIKIESDNEDEENFIVTGIKNPAYNLDIEP